MTETQVRRDEEDMITNLKVQVFPKEQITEEQLKEFIAFFKDGYGDRWVSEDHFRNVVMKNSTELLTVRDGEELVASFNFDNHRITDIAVSPTHRGEGLGVRLFQEAANHNPEAWITIGVDADAMLSTVTSKELNFVPVEDKDQMEGLFRQCNGTRENYQVGIEEVQLPMVMRRLKEKGIEHSDTFLTSYRGKSLHGPAYKQIIFQNRA